MFLLKVQTLLTVSIMSLYGKRAVKIKFLRVERGLFYFIACIKFSDNMNSDIFFSVHKVSYYGIILS